MAKRRCQATKDLLTTTKQCPNAAKYGDWCGLHAVSVGGWKITPPVMVEGETSEFEVPTSRGRVRVIAPTDLSQSEADHVAATVARVLSLTAGPR